MERGAPGCFSVFSPAGRKSRPPEQRWSSQTQAELRAQKPRSPQHRCSPDTFHPHPGTGTASDLGTQGSHVSQGAAWP